ncbi:MAG: hypothetical protein WD407_04490 [Rhodospirillales bacterium]
MAEHDVIKKHLERWFRRWRVWALIYALGFLVLWVTGLAETRAFYVWSIGWVLVWAVWGQNDFYGKYLSRKRQDDERGGDLDDDPGDRRRRTDTGDKPD